MIYAFEKGEYVYEMNICAKKDNIMDMYNKIHNIFIKHDITKLPIYYDPFPRTSSGYSQLINKQTITHNILNHKIKYELIEFCKHTLMWSGLIDIHIDCIQLPTSIPTYANRSIQNELLNINRYVSELCIYNDHIFDIYFRHKYEQHYNYIIIITGICNECQNRLEEELNMYKSKFKELEDIIKMLETRIDKQEHLTFNELKDNTRNKYETMKTNIQSRILTINNDLEKIDITTINKVAYENDTIQQTISEIRADLINIKPSEIPSYQKHLDMLEDKYNGNLLNIIDDKKTYDTLTQNKAQLEIELKQVIDLLNAL
jgi:hypothetical protein